MKALLILLLLPVIFYILYINGYMVTGSKSARVYVGEARGSNAFFANFVACDGELKQVVRFRREGEYHFRLNSDLTTGSVAIEIKDKEKQVLLRLTPEHPEGTIEIESKKRYYMTYQYIAATGSYELTWE